jgi:hypothetical protein
MDIICEGRKGEAGAIMLPSVWIYVAMITANRPMFKIAAPAAANIKFILMILPA